MSALLTADWFQLDSYYRKFDLYTMTWIMDEGLDNMVVSGAPYGGPIAVVRDRKQMVRVMAQAKPVITIYNCVGTVISKILWNSGVLVYMGWSDGEQLLCVQESGDVLVYDIFGVYQKTFSLGQEVRDTKVCKAQFFSNPNGIGLGVITSTNRMFLISNVAEPKIRSLPDLPRANEPISSWCVISSGNRSSSIIGFLICRDKEVYKCQLGDSRPMLMRPEISHPYTQILSIVPSQNGRHVALFTDSGILWIGSSDFKSKYCEIDTENVKQPKELMWCGTQALVAHWDDVLSIYGLNGACVSYPYDGPFRLVPEPDCVRVLSDGAHELLQRVPKVTEKIFRINSAAPASYLLEASKQFQVRHPSASCALGRRALHLRAERRLCVVPLRRPVPAGAGAGLRARAVGRCARAAAARAKGHREDLPHQQRRARLLPAGGVQAVSGMLSYYLRDASRSLVVHWDDVLCIHGLNGACVSYPQDGPFRLVPEPDCVRVLSDGAHELLQRVPKVTEKIFRINSAAPASYLLEASKQFQKRSHRADEYIRLVKPDLLAAVQDCIDAAAYEFNPEVQRMLVRAAQYGKGFVLDASLTEHYVNTCRWLRVLNAVRAPDVAMPLTYMQVQNLGERVLLDRLIWRRMHGLAGHVAAYLRMKDGQTRVLSHWACFKVTQPQLDNESAAREIGERLRNVPGVSYCTIAMKAADKGRKALAIKILEYEPRSKLQVPLLLALGEGRAALVRATASGDTDLLYCALLSLKEKMAKHEFELTIRSFPLAHALYIKYCASHNREALRKVLVQEDDFAGQAATHIRDALEQPGAGSAEASLVCARDCYKKGRNDRGTSICEDARKLCKQQSSLQETYGESYVGLSLHDTVQRLLVQGEIKLADRLRTEHSMPDRRYWWLRILTLAEHGSWEELERFCRAKRSPIGYEPVVDACLQFHRPDEALKYLPRCRDDLKVKYYVKAGFYEEAAQVALEQKDESALFFVQSKCPLRESSKHERIAALIEQLATRK